VRKASPHEHWAALVVRHDGGIVLERRPSTGLLADLWCLPMVPLPDRGAVPDLAAIRDRVPAAQGPARSLDVEVEHVFTHRVWTLRLFEIAIRGRPRLTGVAPAHVHAWHEGAPLPGGMPTITRKLLAAARKAIDGTAPRGRARTGRQATV
jgi:adenine-specific DNA glycosylase